MAAPRPSPPSGVAATGGPRQSLFGRSRREVEQALPDREAVTCPLCARPPVPFGVDFQGLHLARCPGCGLEFQSPRPTFEQLAAAVYGEAYHPADHAHLDAPRAWHYERQLAHLSRLVEARPGRILDVGCGVGAFLGLARDREWDAAGSDVALTDAARATGATLWEGQLPDIAFPSGWRFDVVRFNHVLEHTQDPLRELTAARRVLSAGGVLLVGVPNLAGLSIRLKSLQSRLGLKHRAWKHYGALHHLWFFTPATLARLVRAAGFRVVSWETPVAARPGRPAWATRLVRGPLERARLGGILDLYARAV